MSTRIVQGLFTSALEGEMQNFRDFVKRLRDLEQESVLENGTCESCLKLYSERAKYEQFREVFLRMS